MSRLGALNTRDESFEMSFVVILFWRVNCTALGLVDISDKAQAANTSILLNKAEFSRFSSVCPIPELKIHHGKKVP